MLNKEVLTNISKKLLEEARNSYDDFNSADGKIGDGDLGVTILHGLEEINNSISKFSNDMGANFMLCSQAFVKKSGSSFGTLIAFSFMNISKVLKGKTKCNHDDIVSNPTSIVTFRCRRLLFSCMFMFRCIPSW